MTAEQIDEDVSALGLRVVPLSEETARTAGLFRVSTKRYGLSLADRAALALGEELRLPVLTGDRAWRNVQVAVPIVLLR